MDKLTAIRIKHDDGTYSEEIPLRVIAENVAWDQEHNLLDVLGSVDLQAGDIQQQIDEKIDPVELSRYVDSEIAEDVTSWLDENISGATTVVIDKSLTVEGAAADAKQTGTAIDNKVKVSNTQPTSKYNSVWVQSVGEEYDIPTFDDFQALVTDLNDLSAGVEGVLTRYTVENIQEIRYKGISINSLTIYDAGGAFYVTNPISVVEGEMYEITCSGYGNAGAYAFGNNGVLMFAYPQTTASTLEAHIVENEVVVIPHGVTELYLAKYSTVSNTITCSKLTSEPKKTILVYSDTITNTYTEVPSTNPVRVSIGYNFIKGKEYTIHLKATNVNLQTGVTNQVLLDSSELNSTSVNRLVDVLLRSGAAGSVVSGTDWTIKYTPTTDTIVALLLRFKTSTGTQTFDVQIYATVTYSETVDNVSELQEDIITVSNMIPNQSRMQFGAHRGAESFAPPNSIAAYEIAGKMGFQWAWLAQIRWSAEKTLYVMHDEDVSITTNGTGNLSELSDSYIQTLLCNKIQSYDYSKFTNEELRVPTLEKVIQICVKYGMKMCFRIEPFPSDMDTPDNALIWNNFANLIKEYNIKDGIYSGYNSDELKLCRTLIGENENLCPFRGNTTTGQDYINFFTNNNITGKRSVLLYYQNATQSDIKLLHKNGIEVYVFYNGTKPSQNEINQWATYGVEILQNPNTPKLII